MRAITSLCAVLLILGLRSIALGDAPMQYKVMTYNVLYGAGVNAEDEHIANRWSSGKYHGNRLDRVIAVIKAADPDVLGIQEACHWDENDEAAAKQVAKETGMHYFVGKSGHSRFHVVLFSKLPIISAKGFPDPFSRAAIQAELRLPDGRVLHAFVAHFNLARSKDSQLKEIRFIAQQMRPHAFDLGVFMADANMRYQEGKDSTDALRASGFQIASPTINVIDQVWTSRPLSAGVKPGPSIASALTNGTSDHRPSVVVITIPPTEKTGALSH